MTWILKWEDRTIKQLKKLDKQIAKKIVAYLEKVVVEDPRKFGKPLTGDKISLWRFRAGDYRIICRIIDEELVVLIVGLGHRKEVYN